MPAIREAPRQVSSAPCGAGGEEPGVGGGAGAERVGAAAQRRGHCGRGSLQALHHQPARQHPGMPPFQNAHPAPVLLGHASTHHVACAEGSVRELEAVRLPVLHDGKVPSLGPGLQMIGMRCAGAGPEADLRGLWPHRPGQPAARRRRPLARAGLRAVRALTLMLPRYYTVRARAAWHAGALPGSTQRCMPPCSAPFCMVELPA